MADTVHEALLDATELTLRALDLGGLEKRVTRRPVLAAEWLANATFPCLVVSPAGTEREAGGTTGKDDTGYPLTIRVLDREAASRPELLPRVLKWRRDVKKALQHKRWFAAVPEVITCVYVSGPVVENVPEEYQLVSSPLAFEVLAREAR
jgi:hypothetical protein